MKLIPKSKKVTLAVIRTQSGLWFYVFDEQVGSVGIFLSMHYLLTADNIGRVYAAEIIRAGGEWIVANIYQRVARFKVLK